MRYIKVTTLSILLTGISIPVFSQEQLGLRLSNYSGINGTMFNPAFNVTSPLVWDVNIIAAGAFVENNYIFIKDANLFKVIRNRSGLYQTSNSTPEFSTPHEGLKYDFTTGSKRKEAYVNVFITGPSTMFHVKKHTFGVFFNVRATSGTNRVPSSLGYYDIDALEVGDVLHVKPFKTAGMAWSEIGLNYGRNVFHKGKHTVNAGVTLKFLQGYEAYYFRNHQATDIVIQDDFMNYLDAHVTFGTASGVTGYGGAASAYDLKVRGHGASVDLGAVYYKQGKNKERPYDWKAGFALLDFGKIRFNKNAQAHEVDTDEPFDFVQGDYAGIENFEDVFQLLSTQSLDDKTISLVDNKFSMWTPAGISIFGERAITNHFFINAAMVRRLRFRGPIPERDNLWAITPRYEHRWFEVSIPLVLYNDKDLRLGTAIRLGPLVVGTDNLTSWFGKQKFTGSDVYVALKINPLNFHFKKKSHQNNSLIQPNDCFEF